MRRESQHVLFMTIDLRSVESISVGTIHIRLEVRMSSRGDILAQEDGFVEPCGADFAIRTWVNEPTSKATQNEKVRHGVNVGVDTCQAFGVTSWVDFHYDEFVGQTPIDPAWNGTGTAGAGGTIFEQPHPSRLNFQMNPYDTVIFSEAWLDQQVVEGIDDIFGFDQGFDIWYRLRLPQIADLIADHTGNALWIATQMIFTGGGLQHSFEVQLRWQTDSLRVNLLAEDDTGTKSQGIITGFTENDIWFRVEYVSGDPEMGMYYALSDPEVGGWTGPIYSTLKNPNPTGHTNLQYRVYALNSDPGDGFGGWMEFLRKWE
jgi:hypothetical protein